MLTIEKLNVVFNPNTPNEKRALKDINLTIEDGDFITIIGSNGAGKSTLLNSIFGITKPISGHIALNGINLDTMKSYKRAKNIGILFQNPLKGTAPNMTIYENLVLALGKGYKKSDIFHLVKELNLGLEDRLNTNVGLLSGGQRQAITLIMATGSKPNLLLLDEHTAALDPKNAIEIMELTKKIVERKKITTIMITHNIQNAINYGNRLLFMRDGAIIKDLNESEKRVLTVPKVMSLYKNDLADKMIL